MHATCVYHAIKNLVYAKSVLVKGSFNGPDAGILIGKKIIPILEGGYSDLVEHSGKLIIAEDLGSEVYEVLFDEYV